MNQDERDLTIKETYRLVKGLDTTIHGTNPPDPDRPGLAVQVDRNSQDLDRVHARLDQHDKRIAKVEHARGVEPASDSGSLRLPTVGRRQVVIGGGSLVTLATLIGGAVYGYLSAASPPVSHPTAEHRPAPTQEPEP